MLGIHDFWLFLVSGLLLNIAPGPDTAYIVGRSVQLGWRGGMVAAFGIASGCLVHVFGAAVGLSALLAASSTAFTLVKWVGAAYLCYMGAKMLLSRSQADAHDDRGRTGAMLPQPVTLRQVFLQGALTCIVNPKVALFFVAFLPQFVAAEAPHKAGGLPAAGPDLRIQRHVVVPGRGCLRRTGGGADPRVRPDHALDQPRAGRGVRLSRHPRRHARDALKNHCFTVGLTYPGAKSYQRVRRQTGCRAA